MRQLAAIIVGIVVIVGTACSAACMDHIAQTSCHSDHRAKEESKAPHANCLDKDSFLSKRSLGKALPLPSVQVVLHMPEPTVLSVIPASLYINLPSDNLQPPVLRI